MNINDFIYHLLDYVKSLKLDYDIRIGSFDQGEAIVILPVSGSTTIQEYMNGMVDVQLPFEISIKSKSQEMAFNTLNHVIEHIHQMKDFLAVEDNDHSLIRVMIDQLPYFAKEQVAGYFIYQSRITVDLTINKTK